MWKLISFSFIHRYLSQHGEELNFKHIKDLFRQHRLTGLDHQSIKELHQKSFLNHKKMILFFIAAITILKLSGPLILHELITQVESVGTSSFHWYHALSWCVLMVVVQICHSIIGQHYIYRIQMICQSVSTLLNHAIFKKIMNSEKHFEEGEIINRVTNDSEVASNFLWIGTEMILALLTILISSIALLFYLGESAVPSLLMLFSIFPLGRYFSHQFARNQKIIQKNKDERLDALTSYLGDMEIIKSLGWEDAVYRKIKKFRRVEQYFWEKFFKNKAMSILCFLLINAVVASLAFGLFIYNGGHFTTELAFTCLCYFGFLEPALKQLSKLSGDLSHVLTSNSRIEELLGEEKEIEDKIVDKIFLQSDSVAIVGQIGQGKSTILKQLVHYFQDQNIGYQPQDPFLFEGSLNENITLGKSVDKTILREALRMTFLDRDPIFADKGLKTKISVRGDNLSFSQKQKIVLARTYCLDPKILLLDEPCSSFDSYKVDNIFQNLFFKKWKDKKKVVITSQTRYLSLFDKIIFIDSQKQWNIGTYEELLNNSEFLQFTLMNAKKREVTVDHIVKTFDSESFEAEESEETVASIEVNRSLYSFYLKAMNAFRGKRKMALTFSLLLFSSIAVAFLPIYQNLYITKWTQSSGAYLWALGYLLIGIVLAAMGSWQNYIWSMSSYKAAKNIHDTALEGLLGRYISYFNDVKGTKLVNIFSRNLDTLEKDMTTLLEDAFMSLLHTVSSLLILVFTLPLVIFVMLPIAFIARKSMKTYRKNLCRVKALIAEGRNPRMRSISEVLEGNLVIHSFKAQRFFMGRLMNNLDKYQDAICFQTILSRWFVIKTSLLTSVISFSVTLYAFYYGHAGLVGKAMATMMILYSFKFWENLCWSVKSVNEADSQMVFVKDFSEFSRLIERKDKEAIIAINGDMVFDEVICASDNNNFYSIDSLNQRVRPGEKVGVHTLSDISKKTFLDVITGVKNVKSGRIQLGAFDLSLEERRSSFLSFVSDNTELFKGDIYSNLDPLRLKNLQQLEEILKFVGLSLSLHHRVESGGMNLSSGERRLICLARALVRETPVLVIEESCPAQWDKAYEEAIQKVLALEHLTVLLLSDEQSNLAKCQRVFAIGHRIADDSLPLAI